MSSMAPGYQRLWSGPLWSCLWVILCSGFRSPLSPLLWQHCSLQGCVRIRPRTTAFLRNRIGSMIKKSEFLHRSTLRGLIRVFVVRMKKLHSWLSKMRPVKILIRLRERAVWSESSLDADVRRWRFLTLRLCMNSCITVKIDHWC